MTANVSNASSTARPAALASTTASSPVGTARSSVTSSSERPRQDQACSRVTAHSESSNAGPASTTSLGQRPRWASANASCSSACSNTSAQPDGTSSTHASGGLGCARAQRSSAPALSAAASARECTTKWICSPPPAAKSWPGSYPEETVEVEGQGEPAGEAASHAPRSLATARSSRRAGDMVASAARTSCSGSSSALQEP
mmetsp:Transcript_28321/g.71269  ORF Transcript_28321/g.71269 Transcript_28321/m.71269 type:complete len:200 (-) Transcript_28321:1859-2458(-)